MRQIFVFTAGKKDAREHLSDSITNSVPFSTLDKVLLQDDSEYFKSLMPNQNGFYAWGAVEGEKNIPNWKLMQVGDIVLTVFDNQYRFFATVLGKLHHHSLAKEIWGLNEEGNTWEYMYFLSQPQPILVSVSDPDVAVFLNNGYRGFARISQEKTTKIIDSYGSLESFFEQKFTTKIPPTQVDIEIDFLQEEADSEDIFNPHSEIDGRRKILRAVVTRQGQPKFRKILLEAYEGQCVVSGCNIESVLQAAHIKAYDGENSNAVQNGLLLRADIHTLFDLGLLKVNAVGVVQLHDTLRGSSYEKFHGKKIRRPKERNNEPNPVALEKKYSMVL